MHVYICMYVYIYTYIYSYAHVHISVHLHKHSYHRDLSVEIDARIKARVAEFTRKDSEYVYRNFSENIYCLTCHLYIHFRAE